MYIFLRLYGLLGCHVSRCISGNIGRCTVLGIYCDTGINIIALGTEFRAQERNESAESRKTYSEYHSDKFKTRFV